MLSTLLLYNNTLFLVLFPDSVHQCLLYPHSWVRLVSSRLLGVLFASASIEDIAQTLTGHGGAGRNKVWLAFFVNGGLEKVSWLGFVQQIMLSLFFSDQRSQAQSIRTAQIITAQ